MKVLEACLHVQGSDEMKALSPPMLLAEPAAARPEFHTIYRKHYADVVRWVRTLGGPDMDAEDLAQDVFVVVHKKLRDYEEQNLRGWLYTITANLVSDRRRGAWFRRIFMRPRDVLLDEMRCDVDDPLALLEKKDMQRVFYNLTDEVHASRREAFLLFEVGGMTGPEIAAVQNIPVATVWTRLHLARKEFTAAIAKRREEVQP
jgi:RNA polymerase sigma-70 factor (ECF subfamily)